MHTIQVFWFSVYCLLFYVILFDCEWIWWCTVVSMFFVSSLHFPECVWKFKCESFDIFFVSMIIFFLPYEKSCCLPRNEFSIREESFTSFFTIIFARFVLVSVGRFWLNYFRCTTNRCCCCFCCNYFILFRSWLQDE